MWKTIGFPLGRLSIKGGFWTSMLVSIAFSTSSSVQLCWSTPRYLFNLFSCPSVTYPIWAEVGNLSTRPLQVSKNEPPLSINHNLALWISFRIQSRGTEHPQFHQAPLLPTAGNGLWMFMGYSDSWFQDDTWPMYTWRTIKKKPRSFTHTIKHISPYSY